MDPITAFVNLATELTKLITVAMEGQTPEQRATIWAWYIKDVEWWRKTLKIDQ